MKNSKIVVYTAIFGGYDGLLPQPRKKGVDYICFTDRPLKVSPWKVIQVAPPLKDIVRCARMYKVSPHRFLPDYEYSIWMDGNFLIRDQVVPWAKELLNRKPMWVFDHNQTPDDLRNCVYEEYKALVEMYETSGTLKDDLSVMTAQVERYREEGFPKNHGLLSSGVLIRGHHHPEVVKTMESWWSEISAGSRRDQLSFNYAAWKNGLDYGIIDGDLRRHTYFFRIGKHRSDYRAKYIRYRLKRLLGLV